MIKKQYHIAAPIPEELANNAAELIGRIREEGASRSHIDELFELIMALTESGIDFFFMEPLRRLRAGPVMMKVAQVGLSSTVKGIRMVIRNVLRKMDLKQIEPILEFIEEITFPPEERA